MRHRTTPARILALLAALTIVAAACGADTSGESAETAPIAEAAGDATVAFEAESAAEAPAAEDRAAVKVATSAQDLGRSIIFTADMVVAVTDVEDATDEAIRLIESRGGILFGQQTLGVPEPSSTLTFRVQPADFQDSLAALSTLGEVRSQNVSADDVTELVVDLESRISTAEVSVDRLRALIEEAQDLKTITDLETQLLERETLLETLRGQLRTVRDRVDLATITVTFTEALSRPAVDLQVTAYPGHDDQGASCPGASQLAVEEDAPATVCFEITNVGDTPLTNFEVRDPVLELEMADLVVVFGDPEGTLEPGQFVILAAEINPERTLRTQSRATATPVNQDGVPLESRDVSSTTTALLQAVDPGGLPTFRDGLRASWDALLTLGDLIVLVAGLLIPFLWIPVAIWLFLRWRKARRTPPAMPAPATRRVEEAEAGSTAGGAPQED